MPKVVITMPAYQAETTLERTVLAIPDGVAHELILVDDASRDGTAELARTLGLSVHVHPENRGYGGNQKSCYQLALAADADVVVLLHPDYQYEPKAVPLLIAPILAGEADMTFGSRFAGMGDPLGGGMPLYRYLGNRLTTVVQNLFLGTRFTDMHSGMRAYTREALEALPFLGYPDGFSFDAEFLVDAVTSGLRVVEVPIPTRYTIESSSISVSRSIEYVVHGTVYAARRGLTRGRRGRRYLPAWRRGKIARPAGPAVVHTCVGCGADRMHLAVPGTADGAFQEADFRCTGDRLGVHDDILACARCGLLSSRIPFEREAVDEGYRDAVDEDYLEEADGRRELFDWVLERLGSYALPGRRLVELGSHVGLFLRAATDAGWTAQGVEPSAWAVAEGTSRFGVDLREGDAETVEFAPASADAIVMLDVLEHLWDPAAVLERLRPALAEGGVIAISTVDPEGLHGRLRRDRWPWFTRAHLHYMPPATLVAMLRDAGYEPVARERVPRSFHLSYLAERARGSVPGAAIGAKAAEFTDPIVPVGWLGDVTLTLARPRRG